MDRKEGKERKWKSEKHNTTSLTLLEESGSCDRCFEMVVGKNKTVFSFAIVECRRKEGRKKDDRII